MPGTAATDHRIACPGGDLFARRWRPAGTAETAPAIVLVHDSLGCVELWRDFPPALAAATGLDVVAYDRLGFGQSAAHPGRLALDFMADEARRFMPLLLQGLGITTAIPFGHSVGGAMAIETAAALPDRCAAVVTIAAQAFVEDRTVAGISAARDQFAAPEQVARLARYHGDKARWVLDAWIDTWLAPGFAAWSLDATLPRLRRPILAIHGDRDEYGSAVHPRRIADLAGGGGRAVLLADCGHVPHREQPARVLDEVARFLKGI